VSPAGDALLSTSADAVLLWDLTSLYKKRTLQGGPYGAVMARFAGAQGEVGRCRFTLSDPR
jgi:hypothetical protein